MKELIEKLQALKSNQLIKRNEWNSNRQKIGDIIRNQVLTSKDGLFSFDDLSNEFRLNIYLDEIYSISYFWDGEQIFANLTHGYDGEVISSVPVNFITEEEIETINTKFFNILLII